MKNENDTKSRNEGEGNRTAAKEFNKAEQKFVKSGEVGKAAKDAKKSYEGGEREELEKAEDKGRSHAHGEDPAVKE